jgi:hypothetical protein
MDMFEINKAVLQKATDYIPLAEKADAAARIAETCCVRAEISFRYGADTIAVPDMYIEDSALKARFQMGILYAYLREAFEPVEGYTYLLALDDYDRAARLHPMNALERMKSDAELRDKIFNLLRDYKEFCKMIDAEIENRLGLLNDLVTRLLQSLTEAASPAALAELSQMEDGLKGQIEALKSTMKEMPKQKISEEEE